MNFKRALRIAQTTYRVVERVVTAAERSTRAQVEQRPAPPLPQRVVVEVINPPTPRPKAAPKRAPRARVVVPDAIFDSDGNQIFPQKGR